MATIRIQDPLGNSRRFALQEEEGSRFVLGRSDDCDIVLANDGNISRRHAVLEYSGGVWILQDNHSSNGIQLCGQSVFSVPLSTGQVFSVGNTSLVVEDAGAPAEAPSESPTEPLSAEPTPAAPSEPEPVAAPAPAVEPQPAPAEAESAPVEPAPVAPAPQPKGHATVSLRHATRRLHTAALREGTETRALKGVNKPEKKDTADKPRPRQVQRAGGKEVTGKRRHFKALEEWVPPQSEPGEAYGLPYGFGLQFMLSEPMHAVTEGSILRFNFVSLEDCHLCLVQHDSEGGISLLLPADGRGKLTLNAGCPVSLPRKGMLVEDELVAAAPFGQDTVIAVACTEPTLFAQLLADAMAGRKVSKDGLAPISLSGKPGEVEMRLIDRCKAALVGIPHTWSAAVLRLETLPAKKVGPTPVKAEDMPTLDEKEEDLEGGAQSQPLR